MAPSSRILPLVIASALFMEQMDSTIIATSLPAIAADLGTSPVALKLAFTTYLLGLTVVLPVSGWLADRYGAKHILRLAIVLFTAGSVACGFADELGWLVAARALQGVGGALMVPVGRIILFRSVPKSELVDALAWLTIPALIGPLIGPPIGGFITTAFDWRWIFWMNLPFGFLSFALTTWLMPNAREEQPPPLDGKGFLLSSGGLSLAVFGLTVAGRGLFTGIEVAAMIMTGLVMLVAYVGHARRVPSPILDLRLFRIATFRYSVAGGSIFRIVVGATPFLVPLMLQIGLGFSAFETGLVTFATAFGAVIMKFTAARIIRRFGFRELLIINGVLCCVAIAVKGAFSAHTPYLVMVGVLMSAGFLRSLQFTALNAMAYADVDNAEMAKANALYTVLQQLSLAGGVSAAAFILDGRLWWAGRSELVAGDFAFALVLVSAISVTAVWQFAKLDPGAGSSVSGKVVS